jgi:hypothetical protein
MRSDTNAKMSREVRYGSVAAFDDGRQRFGVSLGERTGEEGFHDASDDQRSDFHQRDRTGYDGLPGDRPRLAIRALVEISAEHERILDEKTLAVLKGS